MRNDCVLSTWLVCEEMAGSAQLTWEIVSAGFDVYGEALYTEVSHGEAARRRLRESRREVNTNPAVRYYLARATFQLPYHSVYNIIYDWSGGAQSHSQQRRAGNMD